MHATPRTLRARRRRYSKARLPRVVQQGQDVVSRTGQGSASNCREQRLFLRRRSDLGRRTSRTSGGKGSSQSASRPLPCRPSNGEVQQGRKGESCASLWAPYAFASVASVASCRCRPHESRLWDCRAAAEARDSQPSTKSSSGRRARVRTSQNAARIVLKINI